MLLLLGLGAVQATVVTAATTHIVSAGPLTDIGISTDLNCSVNHTGDTFPEFFGTTACATLVAVGGTLFGPASIPAGGAAAPKTTYTAVSQSAVTGTGSTADPFKIVTVVDLGTTAIRLTETDSYVVGQESYRTDVQLSNLGTTSQSAILYRAGDCFLQNSDFGFGSVGPSGEVACTNASGRIEQWFPLSTGSHYYEDFYFNVWAWIGGQTAFPDTCDCALLEDNGAGLSWSFDLAGGQTVLRSHLTTFSPLGISPLTTTKTADAGTAAAGATDGYTITIHNPNVTAINLSSITDTLPAGFSYVAGSSTGATTSDPGIVGQDLTWTGSFPVAAGGDTTLHFNVVVSSVAGDYDNQAGGTSDTVAVAGSGPTARITVTGAPPNPPPVVDAGGPYSGNPGVAVNLDGTVTNDPATDTVTTLWTYALGTAPAGSTCTFGSATSVDTTVTCNNAGTYTLTLTANDGVNPAVSDDATLTLTNPGGNVGDGHLWVGLRNSDDQGTQFDVKVELIRGGTTIASGLTQCVTGLTRNQALAKQINVPWGSPGAPSAVVGDQIRISTRIGTNAGGVTKCAGPGGSHNNAVALRLYYDAANRASHFGDGATSLYLHSDGGYCDKPVATTDSQGVTTRYLDRNAPTGTLARCKDSAKLNFNGGNPFALVGTWTVAAL